MQNETKSSQFLENKISLRLVQMRAAQSERITGWEAQLIMPQPKPLQEESCVICPSLVANMFYEFCAAYWSINSY